MVAHGQNIVPLPLKGGDNAVAGVPPGQSLIRTSYMATHTDEELNEVLDVFEKAGKKVGLI